MPLLAYVVSGLTCRLRSPRPASNVMCLLVMKRLTRAAHRLADAMAQHYSKKVFEYRGSLCKREIARDDDMFLFHVKQLHHLWLTSLRCLLPSLLRH